MYNFLQISVYISICIVMHNFVRMTIHIIFGFSHAHLFTNEYAYYYRFLSCISLYEWLFIFFWVFVMHISVLMTIHIPLGFCHANICMNDYPYYFRISSCTSMYKWISIFLLVFVINIFVWMTIHFCFLSWARFYEWLSIFGFRHAHVCTNDYRYPYGFFVMHIFVQMTIHIWFSSYTCLYEWLLLSSFSHAHVCTNDYFVPNFFPIRFCKTGIVNS